MITIKPAFVFFDPHKKISEKTLQIRNYPSIKQFPASKSLTAHNDQRLH